MDRVLKKTQCFPLPSVSLCFVYSTRRLFLATEESQAIWKVHGRLFILSILFISVTLGWSPNTVLHFCMRAEFASAYAGDLGGLDRPRHVDFGLLIR